MPSTYTLISSNVLASDITSVTFSVTLLLIPILELITQE